MKKQITVLLTFIFTLFLIPSYNYAQSNVQTLNYSHGQYVGETGNGKANGQGTYTSKKGVIYKGQFSADTFSGQGTMIWPNGDKFTGTWKNDSAVSGTMTFANGSKSQGIVRNAVFTQTQAIENPVGQNSPPAIQPAINSAEKYKTGVEYTYYPSDNNQSCTPSEKKVCMNFAQYKEICSKAKGITKFAIKMRATLASRVEKVLLEGGTLDDINVIWGKSNSGKEQCYGIVNASGIVDGSSAREEIQGVAMTFIKNSAGEVLVSYFSLF